MSDPFFVEYALWAEKTFPDETLIDLAKHLVEETEELAKAPDSLEEAADCMLIIELLRTRVLLYVAEHLGSPVILVEAMKAKFEKNKLRKWEKTPNGYRHVKEPGE